MTGRCLLNDPERKASVRPYLVVGRDVALTVRRRRIAVEVESVVTSLTKFYSSRSGNWFG